MLIILVFISGASAWPYFYNNFWSSYNNFGGYYRYWPYWQHFYNYQRPSFYNYQNNQDYWRNPYFIGQGSTSNNDYNSYFRNGNRIPGGSERGQVYQRQFPGEMQWNSNYQKVQSFGNSQEMNSNVQFNNDNVNDKVMEQVPIERTTLIPLETNFQSTQQPVETSETMESIDSSNDSIVEKSRTDSERPSPEDQPNGGDDVDYKNEDQEKVEETQTLQPEIRTTDNISSEGQSETSTDIPDIEDMKIGLKDIGLN